MQRKCFKFYGKYMQKLNQPEINNKLDQFFNSSHEVLGENFIELLDSCSLKYPCHASEIPLRALLPVFNKMNVTFDSIMAGKVDFVAIKHQLLGEDTLPARYLKKALSSTRFPGFYMLDYLEKKFGRRSAELTMQNFQLRPSQFTDHQLKNNIRVALDLTQHLHDYQCLEAVEDMGLHSISLLKRTTAGEKLASMSSVEQMFDLFFNETAPQYVEKNFAWKIECLNSRSLLISGQPNQEVLDAFGGPELASRPMEYLRKGFLKGLPQLVGNYFVSIKQLKSISSGNNRDLYELSLILKHQ
jgi:hypothetical protein